MANLSSRTGVTPVNTRISLANNTASNVQNFNGYDSQELLGHVYIDGTSDYRAAVKVTVVKNGAGTYEVAATDVAGDDISGSPIVTFSMSGSTLQATLPNITGFSSAYIDYHLVSPKLNATYPLTVDAANLSYADTGALMFRNKLINGNFDIWQRGTSQTSSGYGSDDRWINTNLASTKTHSRQAFTPGQTDVPGNPRYFSRTVVSSVSNSGAAVLKQHLIEGVNTLAGKKATLSFWAKADASKSIAIEFCQNFGSGGSPFATGIEVQKVALTTSWQKFEITVDIPSISGKTIGTDGRDWLECNFWFESGSVFNDRTDSLGQQSGTFDIAQVQLEEGSTASAFEQRPVGVETSLCERYYQTMNLTGNTFLVGGRLSASPSNPHVHIAFTTSMRTAPSLSQTGTWTSSTGYFGTPIVQEMRPNFAVMYGTASVAAGTVVYLYGGYLYFDAEL